MTGKIVDNFSFPDQFFWSIDDVLAWVAAIGFPEYQNTFRENFITGRRLLAIDAVALIKMNVKNFEHIKVITESIRKIFKIELETFFRSISLTPREPYTHFKFFKIPTGPMHELCSCTGFFKKVKLMDPLQVPLNHFERLHQWLKHIPDTQSIRIGGIKRINLFYVKPNTCGDLELYQDPSPCKCQIPPCDCKWTKKQKRRPWRLSFLVQVDEGKYDEAVCDNSPSREEIDLIVFDDSNDHVDN